MATDNLFSFETRRRIEQDERDRMQEIIDAAFSDFMDNVKRGRWELDGQVTGADRLIPMLNKSESFKELVFKILSTYDVEEESFNPLATFTAHFVASGYMIHAAERTSQELSKQIGQ